MRLGGRRIVGDQLDDACELLDLEQCVPHAELGERASGGVDQLSACGGAPAKCIQYGLTPRRRRLDHR